MDIAIIVAYVVQLVYAGCICCANWCYLYASNGAKLCIIAVRHTDCELCLIIIVRHTDCELCLPPSLSNLPPTPLAASCLNQELNWNSRQPADGLLQQHALTPSWECADTQLGMRWHPAGNSQTPSLERADTHLGINKHPAGNAQTPRLECEDTQQTYSWECADTQLGMRRHPADTQLGMRRNPAGNALTRSWECADTQLGMRRHPAGNALTPQLGMRWHRSWEYTDTAAGNVLTPQLGMRWHPAGNALTPLSCNSWHGRCQRHTQLTKLTSFKLLISDKTIISIYYL